MGVHALNGGLVWMILIFRLLLAVFVLPQAPSKMIDRETVRTYICAKQSFALACTKIPSKRKKKGTGG
jgi:hypothetical protein